MKKTITACLLPVALLVACRQSSSDVATTSLTASSRDVAVGQTVAMAVSTNANAVSWTITPSTSTRSTYSVTTEKSNYITFLRAGDYVVGVRAANIPLDSIHHCNPGDSLGHHLPDSLWNHHVDSIWHHQGHHLGNCQDGKDSAALLIHVH